MAQSIRHDVYLRPYIDDLIQAPAEPDHIRQHFSDLGYVFSNKSQAGPIVTYTGFQIKATEKTIQVSPKTRAKLKKILDEKIVSNAQGKKFMLYNDLESIIGLVSWAASTS